MRKDTQAETHSAKALRRLAASAAVLLAVCLVLMTPVSAYGIFINTNGIYDSSTGSAPPIDDTWEYAPGTHTLTLKGGTWDNITAVDVDLTIVLEDANKITGVDGVGIRVNPNSNPRSSLTIQGTGSLMITVSDCTNGGIFVPVGDITIGGGTITVVVSGDGTVSGIFAPNGTITINDGTVTAKGTAPDSPQSQSAGFGILGSSIYVNGGKTLAIGSSQAINILSSQPTQSGTFTVAQPPLSIRGAVMTNPPYLSPATESHVINPQLELKYVFIAQVASPQELPVYNVRYNADGGTGAVPADSLYPAGMGLIVAPGVTKDGDEFVGWKADSDSGIYQPGAVFTMPQLHVNFTAQWASEQNQQPTTHTVIFYKNDGSTAVYDTKTVTNGEAVDEPTAPSWDNHEFNGWFTEPEGGTEYDFSTLVTENLDLYANWTSLGTGTVPDDEPEEAPANNNNGGGGGGSEGTYDTFPRNTDENGDADFGKSPVVIRIDLPEDTDTAVTLITNPETPETPDTEDTDVYYEFELDIPDYPEETEGDVIWRIPKSLLNDEFGADDYGVYVYDEDEWKPLDSVWEEGDGNYLHYTTKITGDGNFIIVKEKGISKKAGDDTPVVTPGDEPQDTPGTVLPPSSGTETPDDETEIPILGIGIGLLILILVIAGIVFAVSRRK